MGIPEPMTESAAQGGGPPLSMRALRGPRALPSGTWLREQAHLQAGRFGLWIPVALGLGAAMNFGLPREPSGGAVVLALLGAVAVIVAGLGAPLGARSRRGLLLLACGIIGFAAACIRTEVVRAPVAPASGGVRRLEAVVVDVASPGQGGPRILLAPVSISGLPPQATPVRVRLTLRGGVPPPAPGERILVSALLNPPPPPSAPGAYDFARDAYFQGVGGVGLALGDPVRLPGRTADLPPGLRLQVAVNAFRWSLTRRLVDQLGPDRGGLAAAMTTGHEAFVPPAQVEALRAAGLAHIISISGLHMAIVGGFVFALVRLSVALAPAAALRVSGRKLAAGAGGAAVLGYLVLSGAPDPAVRSAVTACAAFAAILADRRALSLRTLALAASLLVLVRPEAVTQPGFQMSFAAAAALVALAEAMPRPVRELSTPRPVRWVQGAGAAFVAGTLISLAAGLATAPFALQHFNRVALYGLPANLVSEPVSTLLLMPALALGVVLTPFGLGEAPLTVAGYGIDALNAVATTFAGLPGAERIVASAPPWTLPAAFLGILSICLIRGPLRWLGLPLALTIHLAPRLPPPDLWIAQDASAAAVREGGSAWALRPDVRRFGAEVWSRRRGLVLEAGAPTPPRGFACTAQGCRSERGDLPVAVIWTRRPRQVDKAFFAACETAEMVILRASRPPGPCAAPYVLDADDFRRGGSAELWRDPGGGWRVLWAEPLRGRRPWSAAQ